MRAELAPMSTMAFPCHVPMETGTRSSWGLEEILIGLHVVLNFDSLYVSCTRWDIGPTGFLDFIIDIEPLPGSPFGFGPRGEGLGNCL